MLGARGTGTRQGPRACGFLGLAAGGAQLGCTSWRAAAAEAAPSRPEPGPDTPGDASHRRALARVLAHGGSCRPTGWARQRQKSGMHGVGVPLTAELPSALKRLWKAPNPEVILAERRGGGCVYRSGAVLPPDQEQAVPQVAVLPWCAGCALPIAREIRVEGGEWCSARTPHLPTVLSLLYIDRPSLPSVAHPEPGGGFGLTGFARGVVQTLRSAFMTPA